MAEPTVRFDDGAAYEQMMGAWSRLAGEIFLDWLAPAPGLRWIDIGCGNGAFTELLVDRCAPAEVQGVDPSEGQLSFARTRPATGMVQFQLADAMSLPFSINRFDAATMALVIFFIPDPAKGVGEMARVLRPGGKTATYAWDMTGRGFPQELILAEIRAMGLTHPWPPQASASRMEALRELWPGAGFQSLETREITVHRTFADFDEFWMINLKGSTVGPALAALPPKDAAALKDRLRARLPADNEGRITHSARANAIMGRLPG